MAFKINFYLYKLILTNFVNFFLNGLFVIFKSNFDSSMINYGDIKTADVILSKDYHHESKEIMETVVETNTNEVHRYEVEFEEEIEEDEFKGKFLPEKHIHKLAVNLFLVSETEVQSQVRDMVNLEQEFPNIEQVESVEQVQVKSFDLELMSTFEFKEVLG